MNPKIILKMILDTLEIDKALKKTKSELSAFDQAAQIAASESASGFDKFTSTLGTTGEKLTDIGWKFTKHVSAPIAAGLGVALNEARKFESSFAGVKKTVDATDAEFEILKKNLKDMSSYLPANINDINGVAEAAGQLGIKLKDIDKFTEVMVNLGVATDLSAETAATQFARLQNIMGFTTDEFERLGSVVVDLGNKSATTESEIMNFTMRLAPMGKQAGLNTQEIMGISAAFTSMGLTAEAGGTAIGKFISNMGLATTKGVGDIQKLEKQFGMSGREMELMSVDNSSAFKEMATSIGMTDTELKQVIKAQKDLKNMSDISGVSMDEFAAKFKNDAAGALDIFFQGLRKANDEGESAIGIMSDMGITEVRLRNAILSGAAASDLFTDSVKTANGAFAENIALQEEADKRYETLDSQLELMKNNFRLIAINLGEQMLPYVKQFVSWLGEMAKKISELSPEQFETILKVLAGIAAVGPGLGLVGKMLTGLNSGILKAGKSLDSFKTVFGTLQSYFKDGFSIGNAGYTASQLDFLGYTTNKAGQQVDQMGKFVVQTNAKMKESIGVVDRFKLGLNQMGPAVGDMTKSFVQSPVFNGAMFAALGLYMANSYKESQNFRSGLEAIGDGVKSSFEGVLDFFGPLGDAIGSLADGLGNVISWVDLLVIALGYLAISLEMVNSALGYVAIALAAFKILTSVIGWIRDTNTMLADSDKRFQTFTEGVGKATTALGEYSDNVMPKIAASFDELNKSITKIDANTTKEQYDAILQNTKDFYQQNLDAMNTAYDIEKEQIDAYYEYVGQSGSRSHEKALEGWESRKTESERVLGENNAKLTEMLEGVNGDWSKLNETQKAEYLATLESMYEEADKILTPEEKRQIARREELLWKQKSRTLELTEEEYNELLELNKVMRDRDNEEAYNNSAARLESLKKDLASKNITQAEYNIEYEKIMRDTYGKNIENQSKYIDDMLEKSGLYNQAEIRERVSLVKEFEELKTKSISGLATQDEKARLQELRDLDAHNISKEGRFQDSLKWLKDEWGPDWTDAFTSATGEVSWDALDKALGDTESIVATSKKAGADVGAGVQEGISSKETGILGVVGRIATSIQERFKTAMEIKSPSRVMKRLGVNVTEGIVVGMEDELPEVYGAVDNITDALQSGEYAAEGSIDISRNIISGTTQRGQSELAGAVARAVREELEGANITARISEGDFEEGVNETLRRDMSLGIT